MIKNGVDWPGIPTDLYDAWNKVFNRAATEGVGTGFDLPDPCPVCGERTLHRYIYVGSFEPRVVQGVRYLGRGAYWEWCSSCRASQHSSGFVPEWWTGEQLDVDHAKLTMIPDTLDEAMARWRAERARRGDGS